MSQLVTCGSMATFPSNNYKIELPKEENTKYFQFWEKNRAQSTWQVVQYTGGAQEMDFPEMSLYCNIHGDGPEKKLLLLSEN